ncbi:MAG: YsnF/AvaK domain-containing protein [Dehalococcoidia bacterium]
MVNEDIQVGMPVDAADGAVGSVKHLILGAVETDVTDLVVEQGSQAWLLPLSSVAGVANGRVQLRGAWSQLQGKRSFHQEDFETVDRAEMPVEHEQELRSEPATPIEVPSVSGTPETGFGRETQHLSEEGHASRGSSSRLQLKEERLRLSTTPELAGVLRVSRQFVEHTETLKVVVREERVIIECVRGTGTIHVGNRELRAGERIEITLMKERVRLTLEPILEEGVAIRKEVLEQVEQVKAVLHKEELLVNDRCGLASAAMLSLPETGLPILNAHD